MPGVGSFTAALDKLDTVKEISAEQSVGRHTTTWASALECSYSLNPARKDPAAGLAFFKGNVATLPKTVKVPHMGWNTLNIVKPNELLDGIAEGTYVYFVHSLYPVPKDPSIVMTKTEYGTTFTSAVANKTTSTAHSSTPKNPAMSDSKS